MPADLSFIPYPTQRTIVADAIAAAHADAEITGLLLAGSLARGDAARLADVDLYLLLQTKASIRTLPLPETVFQVLRNHLERQQAMFPDAEYVFTSSTGTAIDPRNLLRHFKDILKRARLPETIRFHDLRHSCATFLIAQGEHPRVIQDILGHTNISTTMDIYGHVLPETHRTATDGLDRLLGGDTKEQNTSQDEDKRESQGEEGREDKK
jgi:integrase